MNKNYIRGRAFEYQIIKIMTKNGYTCIRSAGSHSVADVICINNNHTILIQAKRSKTNISDRSVLTNYDSDILKIQKLSVSPNVFKQLWVKIDKKGIKKYLITDEQITKIPDIY
jgi:hypothetical protein